MQLLALLLLCAVRMRVVWGECRSDNPAKFITLCSDCDGDGEDDTSPGNILTRQGGTCRSKWCYSMHDKDKEQFDNECTCRGDFFDYPDMPWCITTDGRKDYCTETKDGGVPKVRRDQDGKCSMKLGKDYAEMVAKKRAEMLERMLSEKRNSFPGMGPQITAGAKNKMQDMKKKRLDYMAISLAGDHTQMNMKLLGDPAGNMFMVFMDQLTFKTDDLQDLVTDHEAMLHFFRWETKTEKEFVILYTFTDDVHALMKMKMSTWRTQLLGVAKDYYELDPILIEAGGSDVKKIWTPAFDRDVWISEKVAASKNKYVRTSGGK